MSAGLDHNILEEIIRPARARPRPVHHTSARKLYLSSLVPVGRQLVPGAISQMMLASVRLLTPTAGAVGVPSEPSRIASPRRAASKDLTARCPAVKSLEIARRGGASRMGSEGILREFGRGRVRVVEGLRPAASSCALYAFAAFRGIFSCSAAVE
jgi:hypothetical protein